MGNQITDITQRHNAATAETLLLRELSKRQLKGYKFKRQMGVMPLAVEFVCAELKLVVELYSEHNPSADHSTSQRELTRKMATKGYQVAHISHAQVLTDLVGVIDSISIVVRQCKQAIQMSRLACQYLSGQMGGRSQKSLKL